MDSRFKQNDNNQNAVIASLKRRIEKIEKHVKNIQNLDVSLAYSFLNIRVNNTRNRQPLNVSSSDFSFLFLLA